MASAFITGLSGAVLTPAERAFLRSAVPCGLILFSRNCEDHAQIRALIEAAREAIGSDDVLVLVDQEGGRVQRLRPPLGRALPPAAVYARRYETEAASAREWASLAARLVARDLKALGINTCCAPVLDVPVAGAHDVIGDRAYGTSPEQVADLGRAVAQGFLAGGVLPVIKHIPGHGRATADSHLELPVVLTTHAELSRTDFRPFRELADMPAAMTAHVVFTDLDAEAPASTSLAVTRDIIRGEIGFNNLLMSDDLSMKALSGTLRARAEAVIRAGSDIALHCNGDLAEMETVAEGVPELAGKARARFEGAIRALAKEDPFDMARAETCLAEALAFGSPRTESV